MNWELVLLAKLTKSQTPDGAERPREAEYRQLTNLGITDDVFGPLHRPVWQWIRSTRLSTGTLPTHSMLVAKWPGVAFPSTPDFNAAVNDDGVEEIVTRLQEKHLAVVALEFSEKLQDVAVRDPAQVMDLMQQFEKQVLKALPLPALIQVGAEPAEDLEEYQAMRNNTGGLAFPWDNIVPGGMGLNPAALYCIYGPPGSKKTWMLFWLALWYTYRGFRVLVFSQEMLWKRAKWRMYTLHGKWDWNRVVSGGVPDEEMLETIMFFQLTSNLFVRNPIHAGDARHVVQGIIEKVKPDIIFDDAPYLRSVDDALIRDSPKAVSTWMGFAKDTVTKYEVPYFFTWQPNDDGKLYGGRAGFQDCELVIYLEGPQDGNWTQVELKKNREGSPVEAFKVNSDLCDTSQFGEPIDSVSTRIGGSRPTVRLNQEGIAAPPEDE